MNNGILVPLDGSNAAEIVLPYVVELSGRLDAEIILVSVSESRAPDIDHLYDAYLERISDQVRRQLEDWGAKEETEIRNVVLLGEPAREILRYADEHNVGLVAMASLGSSGQGPWLLGHIAARVLRVTNRPVLLVRTPASEAAIQQKKLMNRILVPLDGSRIGEAAIPCTQTVAKALAAEIVMFQVIEPITTWAGFEGGVSYAMPQDEENRKAYALAYLEGVGKRFEEMGLSTSNAVGFGSSANQIIEFSAANAIDLIAMSTHGRSGIGRWVFGSVTDKVLHAGDTPVLVVRAAKT
jgi:nucleotide-binding universal stress UspA family protein